MRQNNRFLVNASLLCLSCFISIATVTQVNVAYGSVKTFFQTSIVPELKPELYQRLHSDFLYLNQARLAAGARVTSLDEKEEQKLLRVYHSYRRELWDLQLIPVGLIAAEEISDDDHYVRDLCLASILDPSNELVQQLVGQNQGQLASLVPEDPCYPLPADFGINLESEMVTVLTDSSFYVAESDLQNRIAEWIRISTQQDSFWFGRGISEGVDTGPRSRGGGGTGTGGVDYRAGRSINGLSTSRRNSTLLGN